MNAVWKFQFLQFLALCKVGKLVKSWNVFCEGLEGYVENSIVSKGYKNGGFTILKNWFFELVRKVSISFFFFEEIKNVFKASEQFSTVLEKVIRMSLTGFWKLESLLRQESEKGWNVFEFRHSHVMALGYQKIFLLSPHSYFILGSKSSFRASEVPIWIGSHSIEGEGLVIESLVCNKLKIGKTN